MIKLHTHLDLFSGVGGFALACRWLQINTVAFSETSDFCDRVLARHFPGVPNLGDVRELNRATLVKKCDVHPGDVCLVTAGWPCPDFSKLGNKEGLAGDRSGLWWDCWRVVCDLRPPLVILENVPHMLAGDGGAWFGSILGAMARGGYDVEWGVLSASNFGVRQTRRRVYVVAHDHRRLGVVKGQRPLLPTRTRPHPFGESQPIPYRVRDTHGITDRVDISERVGACANAVVPQIPFEIIGRATERLEWRH